MTSRTAMAAAVRWIDSNSQSFFAQSLEKLILELACAFVCAEDLCLDFLQLGCDEALAAYGGLLARVVRRHIRKIRFCHFDEITEDGVVTYLQRLDPGCSDLALLQMTDPIFPFARRPPQLVKISIVSIAKNSTLL